MSPTKTRSDGRYVVRIPADIDRPDRILAGLTARQLAILAAAAAIVWIGYSGVHRLVPLAVFGALAGPVLVAGLFLAVGRRDGLALDRYLLAAARQLRSPRRLVPAPEGVAPAPAWAGKTTGPSPSPLSLPCREVAETGTIDLGSDGSALICRASAVGFALRTPAEQQALVGAFGRFLNSLAGPIQILVRSEPVDLQPAIDRLRHAAGGLPHPALETAALAHAEFLADLSARSDLLTREVLLILRDSSAGPGAATPLRLRAGEAIQGLAAAGVNVTPLDGAAAVARLRASLDPWAAEAPEPTSAVGLRNGDAR